ncbi:hypothetical protein J2I47_15180 [Fibrella sp. HMF5335]|uniref:Colicin import membrane protein n=1 Tax=Fibrella rubiginis TaxID=2817060 RepID=A0A939K3Z6_9BACT|nr:hypothetical protein [Fibrella rubiginis]MBO0937899.1 hypothetical protein [Fibrella rubiginis]
METKTTTEQVQAAKAVAAEKLDAIRTEAGQQLSAAAAKLDELKDQLVARAQEMGKDIDVEDLKVKATQHFETAKAATAETLTHLQGQAETAYAAAAAKADELQDLAEDKFDELRIEAAVQLADAQVKLDEIKAEAAQQVDAATAKAKAMWSELFG